VLGKVGVLLVGVLFVGVDLLDLLAFYLLVWTWAGCAGQGWCGFVGVLLVGLSKLFGLVGVLLVGVDVGWLCWARLVFYLMVF
jgi:proteasome assembly chaperone (PAC2) family protein